MESFIHSTDKNRDSLLQASHNLRSSSLKQSGVVAGELLQSFETIATQPLKQNAMKAIFFSLLSAVCYALVNFILAYISDLGAKELYPCWACCFLGWACYHLYVGCKQKGSFFSKKTSAYYKLKKGSEDEYVLFWKGFLGPIFFTAAQFPGQSFIGLTFYYGAKAGINGGILSSLFNSSVVFVAIMFRLIYGQRLSWLDVFGCTGIVAGAVLVGLGGTTSDTPQEEGSDLYVILAIVMGFLVGLAFAMTTLILQYSNTSLKLPVWQLCFDGYFLYGIILLGLFTYEQVVNQTFTWHVIILANLQQIFQLFGLAFFSISLLYGQGGLVQAISEVKAPLQTILSILVLHQNPNGLEYGGMGLSLFSVIAMVIQKKKQSK